MFNKHTGKKEKMANAPVFIEAGKKIGKEVKIPLNKLDSFIKYCLSLGQQA